MKNSLRIDSLDSLRGIGALIILLGHCYYYSSELQNYIQTLSIDLGVLGKSLITGIVRYIKTGRAEVIMFFMLSGFVLTISLDARKQSYKEFLIGRFFRIYPVLFLSIIISYIMHLLIDCSISNLPLNLGEKCTLAPIPLTIENLLGHLTLTGIAPDHMFLDDPIWSLVYEFRIYLLFPFILLMFHKKNPLLMLGISILLSIASAYFVLTTTGISPRGYTEKTYSASLVTTGYFIVFFAIGIFIAIKRDKISNIMDKLPTYTKLLLLIFVMGCFAFNNRSITNFNSVLIDYISSIGAAILIILAINWRGFIQFLNISPFLWLGHISYSLYLIHKVILYAVDKLFADVLPFWAVIAIVIVTSLLCADLMARFVEYPGIKLGKKLIKRKKAE